MSKKKVLRSFAELRSEYNDSIPDWKDFIFGTKVPECEKEFYDILEKGFFKNGFLPNKESIKSMLEDFNLPSHGVDEFVEHIHV